MHFCYLNPALVTNICAYFLSLLEKLARGSKASDLLQLKVLAKNFCILKKNLLSFLQISKYPN